ncbi:NUDIX hydrolase [Bradyrhizobium sp. 83012]|uniref:NUDIX hydrolase n=1 Tax=Bradyrhizobium aeschynomenes TaxID=2734909 RepID=A0ABX2CQV5_9BRAD|nr:NUDIX hydrolase [Bradyrhizobium aeschynomenes]NPU12724.1 NUDIX hydrolase [Bradyrhizobium aeschynomenes]NPU69672.1 NUDIX hydrolase [Bradyrhizobium aeschynomenes]NPV25623.1 NUDIX hydrolase [Bradyrhizobium aeschynomenes]
MKNKQFAALPFRIEATQLSILLITTRRKQRWSVPKGSPMLRKGPHRVAAIEAYEEAGLRGKIGRQSLGQFKHAKRKGKRKILCDVELYPLKVKKQHGRYPERGQRELVWLPAAEAARRVHRAKLRRLIESFASRYAKRR